MAPAGENAGGQQHEDEDQRPCRGGSCGHYCRLVESLARYGGLRCLPYLVYHFACMAPPRRSERIARELAADPAARLESRHFNPFVFRHLCNLADDAVSYGSADSLRLARLCCRIATRLKAEDARAHGFARLASALRLANRLGHAERTLKIAFAADRPHVQGDLLRRRSILRIYQGRLAEAHEDAEAALAQTTGVEHARALEASGAAYYYRGEFRTSIRQFGRCLAETHPDNDVDYCNAVQNYANGLAKGTGEEARKALKLCIEARAGLKPRHKMQRAKLWWTVGLLHLRLDDHEKAWRALDIARRSLIALEAAPEVAAIVADMARVAQQPFAIRQLCLEAAGLITGCHPLKRPLQDLARAARERIPEAAEALRREACAIARCPEL